LFFAFFHFFYLSFNLKSQKISFLFSFFFLKKEKKLNELTYKKQSQDYLDRKRPTPRSAVLLCDAMKIKG
jgi:hypothetical protein